jgi:predicted nucleic acid-binding protein
VRVLIDTNLILDVWLARQPFLKGSARILSAAETKKISGIICATTVTTLHYLVKKHRGEEKARELLKALLRICSVGTFRRSEIDVALESRIKDFEDAVIEAVALKTGSEVIATRNTDDFKGSRVPAREPHLIEW